MEAHLILLQTAVPTPILDTAMSEKRDNYNPFNPHPKAKRRKKSDLESQIEKIKEAENVVCNSYKNAHKPEYGKKALNFWRVSKLRDTYSEIGVPDQPEHDLIQAVLHRAITDVYGDAAIEKRHKRTAVNWLIDDSTDPFAFLWICEQLDLSSYIVERIQKIACQVRDI